MYKVGVCGHFGGNTNPLDGQTIKTKVLTNELKTILGEQFVQSVDTFGWKNHPFKLLYSCFLLLRNCENVIILPARKGLKVFIPLFSFLNVFYKRKLHHVVIGGWIQDVLKEKKYLRNMLKRFDGVYLETKSVISILAELGLDNAKYLANFKQLSTLNVSELVYSERLPLKLCTFSRVMKEKGNEDAIEAVIDINKKFGYDVFSLHIYGPVDENYIEKFETMKKMFPACISYKGIVAFNRTTEVVKDYFALLFPTHYKREGIPGTIIDAYASGVPVISAGWDFAHDIITDGETGIIYKMGELKQLKDILHKVAKKPSIINNMKKNCLMRSADYAPKSAIRDFIKYL